MAINLSKGQKISLTKEGGGGLSKVVMGLGWDTIKTKGFLGFGGKKVSVDLDASCVLFNGDKIMVDAVWFRQLQSRDGSIVHTGDNRTGDGDGDDEQIIVDLTKVPANVETLVFVVNSFTGQNFSQIENATCRLLDASNQSVIASYNLSCQGSHTAQIMAKVSRQGGEWSMSAIGENASGNTFQELMPLMKQHL